MRNFFVGRSIVLLAIAVVGTLGWLIFQFINSDQTVNSKGEQRTDNFESSTPTHGSVMPAVPINVVINVNNDLSDTSEIKINQNGEDYGFGAVTIDQNKLAFRRRVITTAPDGIYTVSYKACHMDGQCQDGQLEFKIDRTVAESFEDLTGKETIEIKMSDSMFRPKNIRVSKGTKITWLNDESIEHYVNTDSHPAHTYFLAQNSRSLKKGESYDAIFEEPGAYPYHCSAHAATMVGMIVVEETL